MMLAHSADRATQDIDAAIEHGYSAVIDAARIVAERRGWPRSWLNEGATAYMPRPHQRHGTAIFDHPALTVVAATAQHMLAMKAKAARPADRQDVEALLLQGDYTSLAQIEAAWRPPFLTNPSVRVSGTGSPLSSMTFSPSDIPMETTPD